jgi:outer membrane protein TolC
VVEAQAQRNAAEITLNRLLHHPAEEPFLTAETDIDAYLSLVDRELFDIYVGNKAAFRTFRKFAVEEGLRMAPELKQLDRTLAARKRLHKSAKRAFWLPSLFLYGDLSSTFHEGGAGRESALSQSLPQQPEAALPESNNTDWSVGLRLSYPLFAGGSRFSELAEAREDLAALQLERQAAAEMIEVRIRTALHFAGASYAAISFTRSAADAAGKNLELITDAYSRGAVSVVDLLDAQNAALVADLIAASAILEFLIDLMVAQRTVGKFYSLAPEDERSALINRLEQYFDEHSTSN